MDDLMQSINTSIYLNLIYEDRYLFLLKGFGMTLYLTIMSSLLGTLVGALFCKLRFSQNSLISRTVTGLKDLFIGLPTLVLLIMFAYLLFKDVNIDIVTLAIFAFGIKAGSYICDIMYGAIETVDQGEIEAARTLGMSQFMAFRQVVLPQAIKNALPVYKNQLIITMQETSLAGFLAINDLTRSSQIITSRTLDPYLSIIITAAAYLIIGAGSNLLFRLVDNEKHLRSTDFIKKQVERHNDFNTKFV